MPFGSEWVRDIKQAFNARAKGSMSPMPFGSEWVRDRQDLYYTMKPNRFFASSCGIACRDG